MDEAMIPQIKRVKKEKRKLKIPVLNFVLVLFCSFLLIVATFIQLNITHFIIPLGIFSNKILSKEDFLYTFSIIPQIPAVLFIVGLLGQRMGITSIVIYILMGLCSIPIFAQGGGVDYFFEFGFGYILAYIPAGYFVGKYLIEEYSVKNILKASIIGVLLIHIIGIFYMFFVVLLRQESWIFVKGWILAQSLLKIAYDCVLSVIALCVAKYGNRFVNYLIG